jgi:cation diffusion facilitator CzcD-associated flavoprotein CzcO
VDIPALWYQLSFAPNPDLSRLFAPGPELYRYLQDTARRLELYEHLQTNSEVLQQKWDDNAGIGRLDIRDRPTVTARFVISSVGGYVNAKARVDIIGVDLEATILRLNAWDDEYDTRGKRIAVIGIGSSGVQIAAALSAEAANLDVYQRTPAWLLPKVDFDTPPLMRRILRLPGMVGGVNIAGRLAMDAFMVAPIVHLFSRLPQRVLARIMPFYDMYCRPL